MRTQYTVPALGYSFRQEAVCYARSGSCVVRVYDTGGNEIVQLGKFCDRVVAARLKKLEVACRNDFAMGAR